MSKLIAAVVGLALVPFAAQAQQPWRYSAGLSVHYDSFKSDDGLIESDQLSEILSFSGSRGSVWREGDALSLGIELGFVQAWPERGGDKDSAYATPTDILVSAGYSTWDRKTAGFTVDTFINIPTGPTNHNLTELAAIPNPKLVSASILSEGLQIGGEGQYHKQDGRLHYHGGVGYTWRSGIGSFDDFRVDELAGGHDISLLAGADYQVDERTNVGIKTRYTYSIEDRGGDNHSLWISFPVTHLFPRGEASLAYAFSYSSGENRELTRLFGGGMDETFGFLDGLRHTLSASVGYKVSAPLVVRGFVEGSLAESGRSDDAAFFTTDDYIMVGVGASYALSERLSLETRAKYFDVSTKGVDGGNTSFEGGSVMAGVKYGF